jgi:F0F1-type ATP synthase membrane subunit b/b'
MLTSLTAMITEVAAELGVEITNAPMRMVAEVFQFVVLMVIIWVVAIGFGKRKGFVANMLTERQVALAARVESSSHAEKTLADSRHEAAAVIRSGRAKARAIVSEAKKECAEMEAAARAETDTECARISERAESALVTETQEMQLELREQLVDLVSSATRSIMNEKLTVSEQRTLIENTIMESVGRSGEADDGASRAFAQRSAPEGA